MHGIATGDGHGLDVHHSGLRGPVRRPLEPRSDSDRHLPSPLGQSVPHWDIDREGTGLDWYTGHKAAAHCDSDVTGLCQPFERARDVPMGHQMRVVDVDAGARYAPVLNLNPDVLRRLGACQSIP